MSDINKQIIGITLGIRYNRSFRIPDIAGEIIDDILNSTNSPFGTKYFPKVQENSARERTLFNEKNEYLRINTDDLILAIAVEENFDKKFKWIKEEVVTYLKKLFKKQKISNIIRVGIIFSHKIDKGKAFSETVSSLTNNNITEADNISLSFSKKSPSAEGLIRKGVKDYRNKIYSFYEAKSSIQADLDCQYYYDPMIEDFRDCDTENILDEARLFLEKKFHPWLSRLTKEV